MRRIPSTWAAVALSTLAHGALAGIVAGHGAPGPAARARVPAEIPVELLLPEDSAPPVPSEEPSPAAESRPQRPPAARHHHSYPVPFDHDARAHDPAHVHVPLPSLEAEHASVPDVVPVTVPEALPRFALPPSAAFASHGSTASGAASSPDTGDRVETFTERQVAVPARLVGRAALSYPEAARRAELEADVSLDIVVDGGGRVVQARALEQGEYGLAAAAERAVRSYRFTPAIRDGRAVRVRMRWVVQFRLN